MKLKILLSLLTASILVSSCNSPGGKEKQAEPVTKAPERVRIYQVMTRLFGNKTQNNQSFGTIESNGVGKFSDFSNKALQEIKKMSFSHIWYTGLIEHATMSGSSFLPSKDDADVIKGRAGSPYAIKDYYDLNPYLASNPDNRMEEFEALVKRTHENGLKVIIDFVPNHVAREYFSDKLPEGASNLGQTDNSEEAFSASNDFYYLPGKTFSVPEGYNPLELENAPGENGVFDENPAKVSGNNVFSEKPSIHDWFETIKINYGVDYQNGDKKHFSPIPPSWKKMVHILNYWAGKGVDGFRCDMAEMVPVEFWEWGIKEVKKNNPNCIFIAEIYNPNSYSIYSSRGGFDYLYDKVGVYDQLKNILHGKSSYSKIEGDLEKCKGIEDKMLRFLENHDEQRIGAQDFAGNADAGLPMFLLSGLLGKGPLMVYFGQEVGEPGNGIEGFGGEDGRTTIFDFWGVPEHQKWMNNGIFDGGKLSPEQRNLRSSYIELLNFFSEPNDEHFPSEFIKIENFTQGFSEEESKIFLIRLGATKTLAVGTLSDSPQKISFEVNSKLCSSVGIVAPSSFMLKPLLNNGVKLNKKNFKKGDELMFSLKPFSYSVFSLIEN